MKKEKPKNFCLLSYDLLWTIFEKLPAAITVVDSKGFVVAVNEFAQKLYGRTSEEMCGMPVSSIYPKEELEKIRAEKIIKKTLKSHYETKILQKNGNLVDIDISILIVKDNKGEVMYSIGIARDITKRKETEEQLKKKVDDLELFKEAVVERELKMIELEKELASLKKLKGKNKI
ncbi:MAG: hypothetical protein DRN66_03100 [Candidatus Nanohalarchaeota archaeon]|nr:MAG: hypothetical protein DRN66_03100 [Candidatus Nanohaloarchaeota archaeon]